MRMPVLWIQPIQFENRMNRNSATEKPTRSISERIMFGVLPRSRIMKKRAEARLPMIRRKATMMTKRMAGQAGRNTYDTCRGLGGGKGHYRTAGMLPYATGADR